MVKESDKGRFVEGRNGDNLMCPFQCDECHFRNVMGRDPVPERAQDTRIQVAIRRAILDSLWAREPGTVSKNLQEARKAIRISKNLGLPLTRPFGPMGPFPLEDSFGMAEAIVMLERSTDPGRHASSIQFETLRKMRSMFSNVYHTTASAQNAMVMAKENRKMAVTRCVTYGEFFERFIRGAHKRMGDIVKPDRALSLILLHELMLQLELDWNYGGILDKYDIAMEGAFYLTAFCGGLRGEEVPLTNVTGIRKWWASGEDEGVTPHVTVALLGRFKNQVGEKYHLKPLAAVTKSGLQPRLWIGRAIQELERKEILTGPMFRTPGGHPIRASEMEDKFLERLEIIQATKPHLLNEQVDVSEEYGVSRSFRRGSTSEAINRGVTPEQIEANNGWRKAEQAGASKPSERMIEHYTDVRLALDYLLKYSEAL
jgi:hypothetical protein